MREAFSSACTEDLLTSAGMAHQWCRRQRPSQRQSINDHDGGDSSGGGGTMAPPTAHVSGGNRSCKDLCICQVESPATSKALTLNS